MCWYATRATGAKKPALEKVTVKVIPDATSRAVAFETGEVDLLYGDEGLLPLDTFARFSPAGRVSHASFRPDANRDAGAQYAASAHE